MEKRNFRIGRKPLSDVLGRFWEKVDKRGPDDCWEWQGAHMWYGYGVLKMGHGTVRAHRFSWELHNGPIPDGLMVCHKCDNPPCVNPKHMFLGTTTDNAQDAIAKGRWVNPPKPLGEAHHNARLTAASVIEIRSLKHAGLSYTVIANRFGVNKATIKDVIAGRTWRHVQF